MSCILRKRFFSFVYFGCFLSYDFSIDSCYYYYYWKKHLVCFLSANARFMYYTSKRVLHIHFVDLSYYVFQVYKVSFDSGNISLHVSFLVFVLFFFLFWSLFGDQIVLEFGSFGFYFPFLHGSDLCSLLYIHTHPTTRYRVAHEV